VEAAFIVPLVIFMMILLAYASLYLRDVTAVKAKLSELVTEEGAFCAWDICPGTTKVLYEKKLAGNFFTRLLSDETEEQEDYLLEYVREELDGILVVSELTGVRVEKEGSTLFISATCRAAQTTALQTLMPKILFKKKIKVEASLSNNTEWNRLVTATVRVGTKVKGVEAVIKKVNEVLENLRK